MIFLPISLRASGTVLIKPNLLTPEPLFCPPLCEPWGTMFCCRLAASNSFETPYSVASQAPLSMGFPRQENWSGLPFPPPVDLPDPGIELEPPALAGRFLTTAPPGKAGTVFITSQTQFLTLGHWSHHLFLLKNITERKSFLSHTYFLIS